MTVIVFDRTAAANYIRHIFEVLVSYLSYKYLLATYLTSIGNTTYLTVIYYVGIGSVPVRPHGLYAERNNGNHKGIIKWDAVNRRE